MVTVREGKRIKARDEFREWFMEKLVDGGGGSCPELVQQGIGKFSNNPGWCKRLLNEELYPMLYRIGQECISVGRRLGGLQSEVVTDGREKRLLDWDTCIVFERPFELYVALGEMTRGELIAAAMNRERRAMAEMRRAEGLRALAGLLRDDETQLKEVCSCEEALAILEGKSEVSQKQVVLAQK